MDTDVVYICKWMLWTLKNGGSLAICNNMKGTWNHYAKGSKSERGIGKRKTKSDVICMWNLKKLNSWKMGVIVGCQKQGTAEEGKSWRWSKDTNFQF